MADLNMFYSLYGPLDRGSAIFVRNHGENMIPPLKREISGGQRGSFFNRRLAALHQSDQGAGQADGLGELALRES